MHGVFDLFFFLRSINWAMIGVIAINNPERLHSLEPKRATNRYTSQCLIRIISAHRGVKNVIEKSVSCVMTIGVNIVKNCFHLAPYVTVCCK